jgi:tetratricopeptide (TPR) repeat protein
VKLHRLIAERGEEVYGQRAVEISAELAMHFERGHDYKRAAYYLKTGANTAIRRCAYQEAVDLARRGIELISHLPETREIVNEALCLHLTLGVPLIAIEGYASPNVGKVYTKARELYDQLGDSPDVSEVLWGLWTFHTLSADLETAREIAEEFLRLSERLPYPGLAMRGHWALEITNTHLGNFELAVDHFEKALALYDPAQHRDDSFLYALNPGVAMPCFAAWSLWFLGRTDEAVLRMDEAVSRALELSEPQGLAHAQLFASVLHQIRRDCGLAQHYAEAVSEISAAHGLVLYGAMADVMKGWTLSEQGHVQEGIEQMRAGLTALEATATALVRPHFLSLLAEGLSKLDRLDEAWALLEEATTMVSHNGERYYEAELYRLKGELLLKKAKRAEAEQCFKRSLEIAQSQKAKSLEIRTLQSCDKLQQTESAGQGRGLRE